MENIYKLAFIAVMATAATSCCSNSETDESAEKPVPATVKPDWAESAVIYEVNWRQATEDGKLTTFTERNLPKLKELGVDILWFMPINPISELNRKGELGSYYASQNYTALNPEMGTIDDFKAMVDSAHKMGMKVIVDWVANHTGCDNVWVAEHPDWYAYNPDSTHVQDWGWTDTYKLNYDNTELRKAMIDAMKFWVTECNIDGFRCDVAFMVPMDFWLEARKQLTAIKPLFFLAEAANKELCDGAFDMVYNWPMGYLFEEIYKGNKSPKLIDSLTVALRDSFAVDAYQMNHITNHDRNSWDGTEFERLGDGVKAFAALCYIAPGMPLIYTGQEYGYDHRFEFFKKDAPAPYNEEWFNFYKGLNALKHSHKALNAGINGGDWKVYTTSAPDAVFACSRTLDDDTIFYVANLSGKEVEFTIDDAPEFTNFIGGIRLTLKAWEYQIKAKP
ncbi:MAG: alpha-amylase family glycosyl hydrolase [Paludibacteraceae bacterium]|nr:alpha-amylase family glycosyl hydrolase [Paludibacteraceae bacterium]